MNELKPEYNYDMINYNGDLLKADSWNVMAHVANNFHTFGSGIAGQIRTVFPEAYKADLETEYGCDSKLGTFSYAQLEDGRRVYNIYAMWGIGCDGHPLRRNLSYDAFHDALINLIESCENVYGDTLKVGVPKFIGCGLAGGDFSIVLAIVECIERLYPNVEFHVYEL